MEFNTEIHSFRGNWLGWLEEWMHQTIKWTDMRIDNFNDINYGSFDWTVENDEIMNGEWLDNK